MFFEIEKKLKSVAKAMAAFGVLAAIAGAVLLYLVSNDPQRALYIGSCNLMIAGGFALFFGSFFAYGLGQLIENTAGNAPVSVSAPSCNVSTSVPAAQPASSGASAEDEATIVAIATSAIAASRGASACAFKVISVTKIQ